MGTLRDVPLRSGSGHSPERQEKMERWVLAARSGVASRRREAGRGMCMIDMQMKMALHLRSWDDSFFQNPLKEPSGFSSSLTPSSFSKVGCEYTESSGF